ncbi:MAG: hypothetical protein ACLU9S_11220 [Oscillospiraceae bacterium]
MLGEKRRANGSCSWDPFIDQWSGADYAFLVTCLRHTIARRRRGVWRIL